MNSFEANKIFGALLGTVFVLFGGSLLAEGLFHSEAPEKPGYEIVAAEPDAGGGAAAAPAEDPPVAALLQNASVESGQATFKKCQACHSGEKGGPNKVGPHLWDVVDRPVASVSDFSYSSGMKDFSEGSSKHWDYDHLYHFLKNPKGYVSGTAMGFAGIKDPAGRADVIAYLRTLSDSPKPLPAAPAEGAQTAEAAPTDTNPATTTDAGATGSDAQAPAAADTSSAEPAAGAQSAPTATADDKPTPPATDKPQAAAQTPEAATAPAAGAAAPAAAPAAPAAGGADAPAAPAAAAAGGAAAPAAGGNTQTASISGDPEAGKAVFRKCQACHAVGPDAKNKIGPALNGIVGEKIALVEGYSFSSALQDYARAHPTWTPEELSQWLAGPAKLVPGTKMSFPGLNKPEDIANVIAYLNTFGEDGQPKK